MSTLEVKAIQAPTGYDLQMPAGAVLQVVHGSYSSTVVTTSGSTFVATGASITITPKFSSSKILVMFNQHMKVYNTSGNDQGAGFALKRGSTTIWSTPVEYAFYFAPDGSGHNERLYQPLTYLDSPNTTSATTYSSYINEYGGGAAAAQSDSNPTMMTLMEIAG